MKLKSISKLIKKYSEKITVFAKNETLNKKTGKFSQNLTTFVGEMAIFKKKGNFFLRVDGNEIYADIKIFSLNTEPFKRVGFTRLSSEIISFVTFCVEVAVKAQILTFLNSFLINLIVFTLI